ncbi:MAG: M15 family metallopeptidase [Patescibacteria group bacterium]|nr:M15 family metallopeptidase [Patescibacteria group bacterium]
MQPVINHRILQNPSNICPPEIFGRLAAIPVRFVTFAGGIGEGIVEIDRDLDPDVRAVFLFMLAERFPLASVMPAVLFEWDDERSMAANNTSAFNYRTYRTNNGEIKLSNHAFGRAIDLNPFLNPCIRNGVTRPAGARYDPSRPGTLTADSPVTQFLKARGWMWGGDWTSPKDYQHFEKPE